MEEGLSFVPDKAQMLAVEQEIVSCNELTVQYGLTLSGEQALELSKQRFVSLQATGRIEFGEGILKKLILAFCDSPFISQENYLETLISLQDSFYYFKNESMERISDDELIEFMKKVYDGRAQGSLDYLAGTSLEELCRYARNGYDDQSADNTGDLF